MRPVGSVGSGDPNVGWNVASATSGYLALPSGSYTHSITEGPIPHE
jgi:hypothetical protein